MIWISICSNGMASQTFPFDERKHVGDLMRHLTTERGYDLAGAFLCCDGNEMRESDFLLYYLVSEILFVELRYLLKSYAHTTNPRSHFPPPPVPIRIFFYLYNVIQ
ncbi:unnamed protein product, partial [Mesorhabditis spiculigera]